MLFRSNAYMSVEGGVIQSIDKKKPDVGPDVQLIDHEGQLVIPGFSDIHLHAPQYVTRGLGYDKELLPWLNDYTFPEESRFKDPIYTDLVFNDVVEDLWAAGTLHSVIFSSLHTDASIALMEKYAKAGLSAYVGKVNMDRNSVEELSETTEASMRETERFLEAAKAYADRDVLPILTPRFSPSCTNELMRWLGDKVLELDLPIQSHVNENLGEVAWVKELFPESKHYLATYDDYDLLPQSRAIMAHSIHNTAPEMEMFKDKDVLIAWL